MNRFKEIASVQGTQGMKVSIVYNEESYDKLYVKLLDGPSGWVDLFETDSTGPSEMDLAIKVMNAAIATLEEADIAYFATA